MRDMTSILEQHHHVQVLAEVLETFVRLLPCHIPARHLNKPVNLFDTACTGPTRQPAPRSGVDQPLLASGDERQRRRRRNVIKVKNSVPFQEGADNGDDPVEVQPV